MPASPVPAAPAARVALALAAVYVIWGSTYLAIRFALEGGFPPFLLGGVRFLIAGGLMFAFLRWRGVEDVDTMPLRRVQQRAEAELNRMVQGDLATREGDDWRLIPGALEGFEAAAPYLPGEPDSLPM